MSPANSANIVFLPCTSQDSGSVNEKHRGIIDNALSKGVPSKHSSTTPMDVVLLVTDFANQARSSLFSDFQKLTANTYTLICVIAAERKVELDFPGGFDIRLYAVDAVDTGVSVSLASVSGPLTTLSAFRDLEASSKIEAEFKNVSSNTKLEGPRGDNTAIKKHHRKVAVGGTFDHLHIGHKLLLTMTVFIAQPGSEDREITVGITGDELLVKKKHASVLESWDIRQQRSADFVESILIVRSDAKSVRTTEHIDQPGPNGKVVKVTYNTGDTGKVTINYVRISDPFGPTITDESITALVISAETRAGGEAVNDKRTEQGWAPLEVFEVDVLDPASINGGDRPTSTNNVTDFATKISSTEIRRRLEAAGSK